MSPKRSAERTPEREAQDAIRDLRHYVKEVFAAIDADPNADDETHLEQKRSFTEALINGIHATRHQTEISFPQSSIALLYEKLASRIIGARTTPSHTALRKILLLIAKDQHLEKGEVLEDHHLATWIQGVTSLHAVAKPGPRRTIFKYLKEKGLLPTRFVRSVECLRGYRWHNQWQ